MPKGCPASRVLQTAPKADLGRILGDYGNLTQKTGAPRLVIIDSASKFREGSELNDQDVNAFFEPLERFARHTGATVVAIHHLNKENRASKPVRTAAAFRARVSGHSAFINRPRLVFGIFREGEGADAITRIGVLKENVGLGHLEGLMEPYRRDPETYRHVPVAELEPRGRRKSAPGAPTVGSGVQSGPDWAPVALAAVARIIAEGGRVTPTGQHELHAHQAPELATISRAKLREMVKALLADGRLVQGADGAVTLPALSAAQLAAE